MVAAAFATSSVVSGYQSIKLSESSKRYCSRAGVVVDTVNTFMVLTSVSPTEKGPKILVSDVVFKKPGVVVGTVPVVQVVSWGLND